MGEQHKLLAVTSSGCYLLLSLQTASALKGATPKRQAVRELHPIPVMLADTMQAIQRSTCSCQFLGLHVGLFVTDILAAAMKPCQDRALTCLGERHVLRLLSGPALTSNS